MEVRSENTEWNPLGHTRGRPLAESNGLLRSLEAGDVKRIYHPDLFCTIKEPGKAHGSCGLLQEARRLRKTGWEIEGYHEETHIAVIRRLR